ncbi:hypothetical protein K504DRAFT_498024 [Pleomassaria siparia CBS 279.74]|uniref:DNA repair protein-like protein Rad26 n=1 Tax=Pleomassaria siparia CBS 279.74 TaxID=1314801 RepID=A0A6G1KK50_9PLEO|nr:hypothetical protein K504DRAFT_498024 [Pleomassaria siparia CBS 279.74]
MDQDDDFDFSDDDLDDLPANALQQLETTAIRATQHQERQHPESDYGLDEGDEGDQVINLDDAAGAPQASPWMNVASQYQPNHNHQLNPHYNAIGDGNSFYNGTIEAEEQQPRRSQADSNQLLLRIKKLEQDKARLNRDLNSEKSKALSKTGEVDTVRRRLDAANRENERKVLALQQAHNEMLAKHKVELDKVRREREQAQTNNMFLEHDMAREADNTKRVKKGVVTRPKSNAVVSPATTPKRQHKSLPFRDGFEDDDIVMASPSKHRDKDRSKPSTPRQVGKRKRQPIDQSPIPVLQLSEPRVRGQTTPQKPSLQSENTIDPALLEGLSLRKEDDHRFTLLHRLLSHRCSNGKDRILEALTAHALPSHPQKKLSSIIYDSLTACSMTLNVHDLALQICHIFLTLWEQCLQERYYSVIYLILDALQFTLACEPAKTAIGVTERAVPLIIASVDLVAVPIARAAKLEAAYVAELYSPSQIEISTKINVIDCLQLLHLIASSSLSFRSPESIIRFWQCVPADFALVLLNRVQPLPHITLMLRILSTSALPTSLGAIVATDSPADQQGRRESDIVDRLTNLLFETPECIADPNASSDEVEEEKKAATTTAEIWDLRNRVLDLLMRFAIEEHGSLRLITHRNCVGRLIKHLDHSITTLYENPLYPTQEKTVASINKTMKLVYHLATSHPDVDIKGRLSVIQGGHHKFLVSLTRLAFSEGLVLEESIEESVVDMAHAILDEGLSIEEGEGLLRVFSSGNSV